MLIFRSKSLAADDPSFWPSYWTENSRYELVEAYMPEFRALRRCLSPGARILDAGCGNGYVTRALNARGYHAVGIDFDAVSVLSGSKRLGYFPAVINHLKTKFSEPGSRGQHHLRRRRRVICPIIRDPL